MSKFVTYGVTEMLDNDQKFIIDSDRTGPGSITAKDAASSLLSKWAGFETFEEAVQNTISNNQEFIDRDTAIRSETAELKKKIVTTFPAKDASGAVATFESEFEDAPLKSCMVQIEPVQDLHGYDSPWPAVGGKNLFQTTATTQTLYGTTFTVNADGTVTVVGTPTVNINGGYSFGEVMLPAGNYKVNGNSNPNTDLRLTCYNVTTTSVIASIYNNNDLSFTLSEESVVRLYPFVSTSFGGSAITMKPMIRLASITDAFYAPYENICPISGWTGCEVQRTGKNLLDVADNDNTMTRTATAFLNSAVLGVKFEEGKQYTFSIYTQALDASTTAKVWYARFRYSDGTSDSYGKAAINNNATASGQVMTRYTNISEPGKTVIGIQFTQGTNYGISYKDVQLELGSTATPYEPYTGHTYPITFPTEAGTVYGGTLDVTKGELVVDRALLSAGSMVVTRWRNDAPVFRIACSPKASYVEGSINNKIANCLPTVSNHLLYAGLAYGISEQNSGDIGIAVQDIEQTSDLVSWANSNELQVCYKLASPITYTLTPQEITSLLGQNNIWSNTGGTAVEYLMSDVSWYVEKKLRAFQSILAGVEDSETSSKNYSANTYLIFNNDIYRVTKTITAGETIEEGVNVTKTTVAEQLMALAQA